MGVGALVQAVLATVAPTLGPPGEIASLTPREKAALVVVSGLPAPKGVAGVFVRSPADVRAAPRGALLFADQEGGLVKDFEALPPWRAASDHTAPGEAFAAGRATAAALRRLGVHVDLAPVLDAFGGPLGSRHFRRPSLAIAFARGLAAGGAGTCAKHFPGLGSAAISTDLRPRVWAKLQRRELAGFRRAIRAGVPCVMMSHALYRRFDEPRAVVSTDAYRLLRRLGFRGVAITDSLSVVRGRWPVRWGKLAVRAGADLLLFTSADDARRAIAALVPLARAGVLDEHVARVLRFRRSLGVTGP